MRDCNMTPMGSRYGTYKMDYGVWAIRTKNVFCYLVTGKKKAFLIDTAYGKGNLRSVIEKITNLPLIVVNTHTHYDHSVGNGFWNEVWTGSKEKKDIIRKRNLPFPSYQIRILSDGQIFDLGGRNICCLSIGVHHPSFFAFLDVEGRNLFVGDEIDPRQVLLNVRGDKKRTKEIIRLHLANMQKLKRMEIRFGRLLPAHNGAPISNTYVDDFMELSIRMLQDEVMPCRSAAGYGVLPLMWGGNYRLMRYQYKKAGFVCAR